MYRSQTIDLLAAVAELADAQDSKSCDSNIVPVRPRPAALRHKNNLVSFLFLYTTQIRLYVYWLEI